MKPKRILLIVSITSVLTTAIILTLEFKTNIMSRPEIIPVDDV